MCLVIKPNAVSTVTPSFTFGQHFAQLHTVSHQSVLEINERIKKTGANIVNDQHT